jgi:23S rRNA pseudoU1915 N3-methylase RlmH
MRIFLKINKDKGREVVVMVIGGSRGISVLIKP